MRYCPTGEGRQGEPPEAVHLRLAIPKQSKHMPDWRRRQLGPVCIAHTYYLSTQTHARAYAQSLSLSMSRATSGDPSSSAVMNGRPSSNSRGASSNPPGPPGLLPMFLGSGGTPRDDDLLPGSGAQPDPNAEIDTKVSSGLLA